MAVSGCPAEEISQRYRYRIYGISPEVPEGYTFHSRIVDLQNQPELWDQECPYHIALLENVTVELDQY